jgi:hypothetical protein
MGTLHQKSHREKPTERKNRVNRNYNIVILLLALLILFLGLNYRQLVSAWIIHSETLRLSRQAADASNEFQNPEPVEDRFEGGLSPQFWKFTAINGGGQVSNDMAWHAAAMTVQQGLSIQHFPDPEFKKEDSDLTRQPAAGRYNNVTLIGGGGFRPTPSSDVVVKFSSRVSEAFYGSAGVIFQPLDTLRKDGVFAKPFDMFGFAVMGDESPVHGNKGPLCYLALNWVPARVEALQVDARAWHEYEVRLRWISQTEWLGIVSVDDTGICQMPMPTFGPVEVQVWSDNALVIQQPRHWWEMAPAIDLKFQDGGEKQFELETIRIFAEAR